jgi:hypothetical protein
VGDVDRDKGNGGIRSHGLLGWFMWRVERECEMLGAGINKAGHEKVIWGMVEEGHAGREDEELVSFDEGKGV